jgi:hypothetical protein
MLGQANLRSMKLFIRLDPNTVEWEREIERKKERKRNKVIERAREREGGKRKRVKEKERYIKSTNNYLSFFSSSVTLSLSISLFLSLSLSLSHFVILFETFVLCPLVSWRKRTLWKRSQKRSFCVLWKEWKFKAGIEKNVGLLTIPMEVESDICICKYIACKLF